MSLALRPIVLGLAIGLVSLVLAGCSMVPGAGRAELAGSTWTVVSVDEVAPVGRAPALEFDSLGRSVTLTTECGTLKGSFGMDTDRATLFIDLPKPPSGGCDPALAEHDVALLEALATTDRWSYASSTEITFHGAHEVRLRRSDGGA